MQPTADEYIQAGLAAFRAQTRDRTHFGPAGRTVERRPGERLIYGPNGNIIGRVIEDEHGNTQIEQDDKLHAQIRLPLHRFLVRRSTGEVVKSWTTAH